MIARVMVGELGSRAWRGMKMAVVKTVGTTFSTQPLTHSSKGVDYVLIREPGCYDYSQSCQAVSNCLDKIDFVNSATNP